MQDQGYMQAPHVHLNKHDGARPTSTCGALGAHQVSYAIAALAKPDAGWIVLSITSTSPPATTVLVKIPEYCSKRQITRPAMLIAGPTLVTTR
ncbi:hypothetical protein BKA70DRAFT_1431947 [Coprinopsis sp. MPI-PUGE-AT-0042]|nr:hypothetical protein BKA70DRAFT_1431942 [Coprinopsis sp. MPI-PUGE-AT-0042]KAH6904646.1 hypothetical protein BKA70DRAFT_1431947 [Coprinopsis sp. MPI-PUGE-AT-0042]